VLYKKSKEINETLLPETYVFPSYRTAMWESEKRLNTDPESGELRRILKVRYLHLEGFAEMEKEDPWTGDTRLHKGDYTREEIKRETKR
jgi:hypothetical protein